MSRTPSAIVGIDLGVSSFKAIRLQRKGTQYVLSRVAMLPNQQNASNAPLQTEQNVSAKIKELSSLVKTTGADVHYTINSSNGAVRYIELPRIPLQEMRLALKLNSTTHLRQSFENYTFDTCPLDGSGDVATPKQKGQKDSNAPVGKVKMVVGGIPTAESMLFFHSSRRAGIKPQSLQLSAVALINGFEVAFPDIFHNQHIAIVDFGYLCSSVTVLDKGIPLLTRVVPVGGKQVTDYIAQISNIDLAQAETAKQQNDPNLTDAIARTATTLIREICSSINFFEKNSDHPISKVYLTGAAIRSPTVVEALAKEIGTACEAWNGAEGLTVELPVEQQDIYAQNSFAFSSAISVARAYTSTAAPIAAQASPPAAAPTPA